MIDIVSAVMAVNGSSTSACVTVGAWVGGCGHVGARVQAAGAQHGTEAARRVRHICAGPGEGARHRAHTCSSACLGLPTGACTAHDGSCMMIRTWWKSGSSTERSSAATTDPEIAQSRAFHIPSVRTHRAIERPPRMRPCARGGGGVQCGRRGTLRARVARGAVRRVRAGCRRLCGVCPTRKRHRG